MEFIILLIFLTGYLVITLENPLRINKAATALLTGVLCWTVYAFYASDITLVNNELIHHIGDIAGILFFLLGAMVIVELIDAHDGFEVITEYITTVNKRYLLWIITFLTFFLSAVLDNLTTAIVMTTLCRKLIGNHKERMLILGMVIIAANAGGAWSPIGDVTTTMLWIGGQITAGNIVKMLFVPSLVCALVPLIFFTFQLKGSENKRTGDIKQYRTTLFERRFMLIAGIASLLFVPVFKTTTHLPPYMGILFSLGILWIISTILHRKKESTIQEIFSVEYAIKRIETSGILFFLGILTAVAALQSTGMLSLFAVYLKQSVESENLVVIFLGFLSAIVDNVPLVAAAMGMYDLTIYPQDHYFWEFLAYACGTGGSMLIIGSAAGIAVMGMEKISFFWYLKKISVYAVAGYLAGAFVYVAMEPLF